MPEGIAGGLSPIIEACRLGFLGVGTAAPRDLAISAGVMVILLLAGLMLCTHIERSFADTV